ncbi:hypothetical protein Tco_0122930 [Tanacetum coccineum]
MLILRDWLPLLENEVPLWLPGYKVVAFLARVVDDWHVVFRGKNGYRPYEDDVAKISIIDITCLDACYWCVWDLVVTCLDCYEGLPMCAWNKQSALQNCVSCGELLTPVDLSSVSMGEIVYPLKVYISEISFSVKLFVLDSPILIRSQTHHYAAKCNCIMEAMAPFSFLQSGVHKKGFDNLIKDSWSYSSFNDSNKIILLKKKLQALKASIKEWCKDDIKRSNDTCFSIKARNPRGRVEEESCFSILSLRTWFWSISLSSSNDQMAWLPGSILTLLFLDWFGLESSKQDMEIKKLPGVLGESVIAERGHGGLVLEHQPEIISLATMQLEGGDEVRKHAPRTQNLIKVVGYRNAVDVEDVRLTQKKM